jgi:hypothetical protein
MFRDTAGVSVARLSGAFFESDSIRPSRAGPGVVAFEAAGCPSSGDPASVEAAHDAQLVVLR